MAASLCLFLTFGKLVLTILESLRVEAVVQSDYSASRYKKL